MHQRSDDRFTSRLDARIAELTENIADLDSKLKMLQAECLDPSVILKMRALASEHLDILLKSRYVMQEIASSKLPRAMAVRGHGQPDLPQN